jgi:cysteine desulfurase family protein
VKAISNKQVQQEKFHYLDHASTTFPKPKAVIDGIDRCMQYYGVNPGRGSHHLAKASEAVFSETRRRLGALFYGAMGEHIAFTSNATAALNLALNGFLEAKDHVVTTNFEHNSVLRPLALLVERKGIRVTTVFSDDQGFFDLAEFEEALTENTKLVVVNHASNVLGIKTPVEEILTLCKRRNIAMLLDASQTIGVLDLTGIDVDFIAFTGHKGLYAPSGIGGLVMKDPSRIRQLVVGGTGGSSHSLIHPEQGHERFEAGTVNYVGLAGLGAALAWLEERTIKRIFDDEMMLLNMAIQQLSQIEEVEIYGSLDRQWKIPLLSFNIKSSLPTDVARRLDEDFNVQVRAGLQILRGM